ncbi:MAG: ABC transporter ATP-binding protein [Jatrophihabitans sp.]
MTASTRPLPSPHEIPEPHEHPVLELVGVRAGYDGIEVLRGVDLAVPVGSVVALLGPNGGGKTTTMRVCTGLVRPTGGELRLAGRTVTGATATQLARLGVCAIPEGRGVFANLTVRENLWLAARSRAALPAMEEAAYARFPKLGQRRKQLAGTMSGGEQQMLALARALGTNPAVLLLDELSMGLAPLVVAEMYDVVAQLAADGISVLLAEQFARVVLPIADHAALFAQGRVMSIGDPAEIEQELSRHYLGG